MKNIIYCFSAILVLTSCSDFLEPQSQTEYVPRSVEALSEVLLGNAYIDATNQSNGVFSFNEILSDDWACTAETGNNTDNATEYSKYKSMYAWQPDMVSELRLKGIYNYVWSSVYKHILGCNAVLDYVDQVSGKEEQKVYVRAQALALRAFYYFHLVNLYGEPYNYNKKALGVPLKLNSNMEIEYLTRSTVEEVYAQVEEDLNQAERDYLSLPGNMQFIKDGRATLPMVQLMKARLYLYKEDYEQAIASSLNVVDDWGVSLLDLNSFVKTTAAPYYLFSKYTNPEALWIFGSSTDMTRYAHGSIRIAPGSAATNLRKMFNAAPALVGSYDADDLRLQNYIVRESATISNYVPWGKSPVSGTYSALSTDFGRALRLSEAHLMLAEAYCQTGKPAEAVKQLELLRAKRYKAGSGNAYKVPAESTEGEALLQFIKEERRREMCFEGLRWFDLRRWGMEGFSRVWREEGEETTFTLSKNDPAFTLPVPIDAIEKNPKLEQNKLTTPRY